MRTEMDYLVLGDFLLDKRDQKPLANDVDWQTEFELDWFENDVLCSDTGGDPKAVEAIRLYGWYRANSSWRVAVVWTNSLYSEDWLVVSGWVFGLKRALDAQNTGTGLQNLDGISNSIRMD